MNLKYYLRGLGMGIIVTALIMGIAVGGRKETLSDSEIKERARVLGMTEESTRLADAATIVPETEEVTAQQEEAVVPTKEPEATSKAETTTEPTAASTPEATAQPTPKATAEPTAKATTEPVSKATPEATPEEEEGSAESSGTVTIQVNNGDGSHTVCRKLEEAGLVISASDFDMYLYENGYDKRINVGTFEIPEGADPQQIARILAGLE